MITKQKRVVIVEDGRLGPEHYRSYIDMLRQGFESVKLQTKPGEETTTPAAVVEVVRNDEVESRVVAGGVDMVVFISVDMVLAARFMKRNHPKLVVVVLPGETPTEEPFIIPKEVLELDGIKKLLEYE